MKSIQKSKEWCHNVLNFPYRRTSKVFNGFLLFFVIISLSVVPIHLLTLDKSDIKYLVFIEKLIVTIFSVEYILRIWVSPNPFRYIFSIKGFIDLLSIFPYYLSIFGLISSPHIYILLRVFRIFKFDEIFASYAYEDHPEKELILHRSISIMPNEKIERIIQRHPLIFVLFSIMPLFMMITAMLLLFIPASMNIWNVVLSILFFSAAGLSFFKNWLDQNYDIMLITNRRVIFQQREIFGAKSNSLNYESINNVILDNVGLLRWVFKYGNIKIETANRDGTIDYFFAPNPETIVNRVSKNMHQTKNLMASQH